MNCIIVKMDIAVLLRQSYKMTAANLKTRYRNTWSGALWVFLNPLLIFSAQSYAFHYILKINIDRYPLFLLTGLLPWTFIVSSVEMSTASFLHSGRFLKSFSVSPGVIVVSQVADNFINYVASFLILLIPISLWMNWPISNLIYMFPSFVSLFIFVVSFSFLSASVNVFFRDTRFVVSFVMQIMFYLTPIFYPLALVPEEFRWITGYNFFYYIIYPFQLLHSTFTIADYGRALGSSFIVSSVFLALSVGFWRYKRNEIYFSL